MLSIIIATCNDRIENILLPRENEGVKYLIVHQLFEDCVDVYEKSDSSIYKYINERSDVEVFPLYSRGLSKSRNFGLSVCKTQYAHIMDDDVDIDVEEIKRMVSWMDSNCIDVATGVHAFKTKGFSSNRKRIHRHNKISLFGVSSIDICINVFSIRRCGVWFDERFGLGADHPSGEELIFLADCCRSKLSVLFFPACVGIHPDITSGEDFYTTREKIVAKKEMIKRVFGKWAMFFIFAFWVKKAKVAYSRKRFLFFTKIMLSR